jgi:hypothetical protein
MIRINVEPPRSSAGFGNAKKSVRSIVPSAVVKVVRRIMVSGTYDRRIRSTDRVGDIEK